MNIHDIDAFVAQLLERGYKRETNPIAVGRAYMHYWKGVWRNKGQEYRDYTVVLKLYDRRAYPGHDAARFGAWGLEYSMTVNHQTDVHADLVTVDVLHETMTIEEWEARCAVLYPAMVTAFASK